MSDFYVRVSLKLEKLKEYTDLLQKYQGVTAEELQKDMELRGVVERYLHLAAEVCIDIAEMIISAHRLSTPQDARDAIDILGQEEIIDDEFAFYFADIAGFRNVLVHEYAKIDYHKVAHKLNNNLGDFDTYADQITQYLKKH